MHYNVVKTSKGDVNIADKSHLKRKYRKNRRRKRKAKSFNFYRTVLNIVIIVVIAFTASIVFRSHLFGNDKDILGFRSYVTLSNSMSPLIKKGSLVIARRVEAESINEGDIITYTSGTDTLTQRVAEIENNDGAITFITKGDAYEGVNSKTVNAADLIGRFVYSVSHAGNVLLAVRNPVFMSLCVAGVCVCFIAADIIGRRHRKRIRRKKRQKRHNTGNEIKMAVNNWSPTRKELNSMELVIPRRNAE